MWSKPGSSPCRMTLSTHKNLLAQADEYSLKSPRRDFDLCTHFCTVFNTVQSLLRFQYHLPSSLVSLALGPSVRIQCASCLFLSDKRGSSNHEEDCDNFSTLTKLSTAA